MIAATARGDGVLVVRTVAMLLIGRIPFAVERMPTMLRRGPARRSVKREEDQPPAIEAGQQRGERAEPESDRARYAPARPGTFEDCVLGPKAGEANAFNADAGDRQGADHHHPEGDRDLLPQR